MLGDEIDNHFIGKAIRSTETMKQALEGVDFFVHCQKEEKYVTKIMSTHGTLSEVPAHQTFWKVHGQQITFWYPEPIFGHNRAKHWVDDHNNHRHDPIDLAEGWQTKWWLNWQYSFFLALSEVNTNACCSRAEDCPPKPQLEFRRKLALKMINNNLDDDGNNMPVVEAPKLRSYTQQVLTDPKEYITKTLLPTLNISLREYVCWLGLTFFMACFEGVSNRKEWWSNSEPTREPGAPFRLINWMSGRRYDQILQAHCFTDHEAPAFVDKFFEICQLHKSWNDYYASNYIPSWFNTLDESMNVWLNEYCPGWMCVPRKPNPFVNE